MREARAHARDAQGTADGGEPSALRYIPVREERVQEAGHVGIASAGGVHFLHGERGDIVVPSVVHVRAAGAQCDDGHAGPELHCSLRTLHDVRGARGQLELVLTELDHVEPSGERIPIEGLGQHPSALPTTHQSLDVQGYASVREPADNRRIDLAHERSEVDSSGFFISGRHIVRTYTVGDGRAFLDPMARLVDVHERSRGRLTDTDTCEVDTGCVQDAEVVRIEVGAYCSDHACAQAQGGNGQTEVRGHASHARVLLRAANDAVVREMADHHEVRGVHTAPGFPIFINHMFVLAPVEVEDRIAFLVVLLATTWYAVGWDHAELVPVASLEGFDSTTAHDAYRDMLVARSLLVDGVPRLLAKVFILHPPGFFSVIAAVTVFTGDILLASHLVVAGFAGMALAFYYLLLRMLLDRRTALATVTILALHPAFVSYARLVLHPAMLCFLYAATHVLYLKALDGDRHAAHRGFLLAFLGMLTKLNYGPCLLSLALLSAWRRARGRDTARDVHVLCMFIAGAVAGQLLWSAYLYANGLPIFLKVMQETGRTQAEEWGVGGEHEPLWTLPGFAGWPIVALAALGIALRSRDGDERPEAVPLLAAWAVAPLLVFAVYTPVLFRWKFVVTILLPLVALAMVGVRRAVRGDSTLTAVVVAGLVVWCVLTSPTDPHADAREGIWRTNQAVLAELSGLENPEGVILSPTFFREIALFTGSFSEHVVPDENITLVRSLGYGTRWVFSHGPVPVLEGQPFVERVPLASCPTCHLLRVDQEGLAGHIFNDVTAVPLRVVGPDGEPIPRTHVRVLPSQGITVEGDGMTRFDYWTTAQGQAVLRLPPRVFRVQVFPFGFTPTMTYVTVQDGATLQCTPTGVEDELYCVPVDEILIRARPRWRWLHHHPFSRI